MTTESGTPMGAYLAMQSGWVAGLRDAAYVLAERGLIDNAGLSALDDMQRSGSLCRRCNGLIERYDPTGDGLAEFWSHSVHPKDGHDAEPIRPAFASDGDARG